VVRGPGAGVQVIVRIWQGNGGLESQSNYCTIQGRDGFTLPKKIYNQKLNTRSVPYALHVRELENLWAIDSSLSPPL